jgi:hypothetical protein
MNAEEAAQLIQQVQFLTDQLNTLQQQSPVATVGAHRLKPRKPDDFRGQSKYLSSWLYSVELYCHSCGIIDDAQKIKAALPYLSGSAGLWLRKFCPPGQWDNSPWSTWAGFCTALTATFGVLEEHQQARDQLDQLRQRRGQPMDEYVTAFRMLQLKLPRVTEDELVHRFRKTIYSDDVKKYLAQALVNRDLGEVTFEEVAALAVAGERQLSELNHRGRNSAGGSTWQPRPHTPPPPNRPVSMDIGNVNARDMDRDTLMREGRCFYCRHTGHRKADCPELKRRKPSPSKKGYHRQ